MCKVLIFGCIAAVILMTAAYGAPLNKTEKEACLQASITDLGLLKDINNDFLYFYTPNDRQECNHTTLACFLKELQVLKQDVEEEKQLVIINIEKNLEDLMGPHFSNPTCKKCEANEKKKFPEFHQDMTRFLQSMQK
ncbi:IL15 protein, partial [Hypocryptadius cinnamomeus]|nr:IL15 protein [Hypocryptadius cinnamomeus]